MLGAGNQFVHLGSLVVEREFCLAVACVDPKDGIAAVAVDGVGGALLLLQRQSVNDGKKLTYVVGAEYGAVMEELCAALYVNAPILHLAGIAAACGIDSIGILYNVNQ